MDRDLAPNPTFLFFSIVFIFFYFFSGQEPVFLYRTPNEGDTTKTEKATYELAYGTSANPYKGKDECGGLARL